MKEPREDGAKWNKPDTEVWSHFYGESKRVNRIDRRVEWWLQETGGREWGGVGQRYKVSSPVRWTSTGVLMYNNVAIVNNIGYLKFAKRVKLKCHYQKKW